MAKANRLVDNYENALKLQKKQQKQFKQLSKTDKYNYAVFLEKKKQKQFKQLIAAEKMLKQLQEEVNLRSKILDKHTEELLKVETSLQKQAEKEMEEFLSNRPELKKELFESL